MAAVQVLGNVVQVLDREGLSGRLRPPPDLHAQLRARLHERFLRVAVMDALVVAGKALVFVELLSALRILRFCRAGGEHESQRNKDNSHMRTFLSRKALVTTLTELAAIAAPATMGESSRPKTG